MGNFFKNFGVLFLITFFALGATGCSEEKAVDKSSLENDFISGSEVGPFGTEGMPEGYLQVSFEDMMGFDAFLNMEKFRPAQPPGFSAYELTEGDINKLAKWRSPQGVPWTAWAYESVLTFETHEKFGIRATAAGFVIPDQTYKTFGEFLLRQEGIDLTPEVLDFFSGGGAFPKELEALDELDPYFPLTRWFRENVSAMIREPFTAIAESYAWYTSPNYEKGTLPGELEEALDLVGKGVVSENYKGFGVAEDWANNAAEIIRGGQIDTPEGPFFAAVSDRFFLQMESNFASLEFYRDLNKVLSTLEENQESFPEAREDFRRILDGFPGLGKNHLHTSGEILFEDFEFLQEHLGSPDEEIVVRGGYSENPLSFYRNQMAAHLSSFKFEVEAFIRTWSELQGLTDE